MYENANGGGHWMDFDRLAAEFLAVDLSAVADVFMLASVVSAAISIALYGMRDRWVPAPGRLVALEPKARGSIRAQKLQLD